MGILQKLLYYIFFKNSKKHSYKNKDSNTALQDVTQSKIQSNTQIDEPCVKNKEKGEQYELQILGYYKKQGYKVYPQGLIKGKADGGIDLIAHKDKETLLIQCKNWEHSQVKQEHLRIFLGDCTAYIEQNQKTLAKRSVRRVFITSCKNMDYGVKKFVEENNIEYNIIRYLK